MDFSTLVKSFELMTDVSSDEFLRFHGFLESFLLWLDLTKPGEDWQPIDTLPTPATGEIDYLYSKLLLFELGFVEDFLIKPVVRISPDSGSFLSRFLNTDINTLSDRELAYFFIKTRIDISEIYREVGSIAKEYSIVDYIEQLKESTGDSTPNTSNYKELIKQNLIIRQSLWEHYDDPNYYLDFEVESNDEDENWEWEEEFEGEVVLDRRREE